MVEYIHLAWYTENRAVGGGVHSSGSVYGRLWFLLNVNECFVSIKCGEYFDLL